MRMIQSSALDVLLARALETSALGTSRQAKDRLIVEALHGPAEPESETVVILAVEVKLAIEGRGVFQEARVLLIVVAEARVDRSGVRNERQNFQRQGRQSYRSWVSWAREVRNYIVRERRAICGGCQGADAVELVGRAMEGVCARLQNDVSNGATGASERGGVVARAHVDRLNGLCGRDVDLQQPGTLIVIHALDLQVVE